MMFKGRRAGYSALVTTPGQAAPARRRLRGAPGRTAPPGKMAPGKTAPPGQATR